MAIQNPFAGDIVLGDVWEQGFLAGFAEPEIDHFRPFSPDLLDTYLLGEQNGRDERRRLPPDAGGDGESGHSLLVEIAEEFGLHALGHGFFEMIFGEVGGLIPLVISVLQLPGDTPIHPLEPDWTGPVNQPDDVFVAVCPRNDHPLVQQGVTSEGYWSGPGRSFYSEAFADMESHGHPESSVARCAVPGGECGLVWPGTGQ